jgi:hypothetical protein
MPELCSSVSQSCCISYQVTRRAALSFCIEILKRLPAERDTIESSLFVKQFLVDRSQASCLASPVFLAPVVDFSIQSQLQKLSNEREDIVASAAPATARAAELTAAVAQAQNRVSLQSQSQRCVSSVLSHCRRPPKFAASTTLRRKHCRSP